MDFVAQDKELKSSASGRDSTIFGSELEDNLDVCLELEPYQRETPTDSGIDDNSVGVFEGDCNLGDIANLFMF
jgi:hypothetical protein